MAVRCHLRKFLGAWWGLAVKHLQCALAAVFGGGGAATLCFASTCMRCDCESMLEGGEAFPSAGDSNEAWYIARQSWVSE